MADLTQRLQVKEEEADILHETVGNLVGVLDEEAGTGGDCESDGEDELSDAERDSTDAIQADRTLANAHRGGGGADDDDDEVTAVVLSEYYESPFKPRESSCDDLDESRELLLQRLEARPSPTIGSARKMPFTTQEIDQDSTAVSSASGTHLSFSEPATSTTPSAFTPTTQLTGTTRVTTGMSRHTKSTPGPTAASRLHTAAGSATSSRGKVAAAGATASKESMSRKDRLIAAAAALRTPQSSQSAPSGASRSGGAAPSSSKVPRYAMSTSTSSRGGIVSTPGTSAAGVGAAVSSASSVASCASNDSFESSSVGSLSGMMCGDVLGPLSSHAGSGSGRSPGLKDECRLPGTYVALFPSLL